MTNPLRSIWDYASKARLPPAASTRRDEGRPTAAGPCPPSRRSGTSWRSSGPGSTICAGDLRRADARSPQGRELPSASASLSSPRSTGGSPRSVVSLPRGNDFLETLPIALVELKGFVEPILEVIGAPFL